jgi:hypothetical protein
MQMVFTELYNMPVCSTKLVRFLFIVMLVTYQHISGISQTLTSDGKVKYTYSDGSQYEGAWKNGPHGMGIYLFADGSRYDGEWKNGKFDGKGIYYYHNGDVYKGEWKNGKKHGAGTYRSANGREHSGTWLNDAPVQDKASPDARNSLLPANTDAASRGESAAGTVRERLDRIFDAYKADYGAANTAQDADYLTATEKDAIYYLNLVRMNPPLFADTYVKHYVGIPNHVKPYAFDERKQSLIRELKRLNPLDLIYPNREIYEYASCFARESGMSGTFGHVRSGAGCQSNIYAECCSYGHNDGLLIILDLLIDAGENNAALGHRKLCLGQYGMAGVSIHAHLAARQVCVLNFGYNPDSVYTIERYTGHVNIRGEYHGTGAYRYANGDVYSGEWENGKRHGRGTYRRADGKVYEGLWKNNSHVK